MHALTDRPFFPMESASQPASDCHNATTAAPALPALRVDYEQGAVDAVLADAAVLAVIGFGGAAAASSDPRCLRVALDPAGQPAPLEVWRTHGKVECGRNGDLAWASDGDYSFGAIELDETAHGGIAAATRRAYEMLHAWRRRSATPHLLRIWNYLDAINLGTGDDERYRQFCAGRAAGMDTGITDYPAATAIGVRDGRRRIQVYWLATRHAGTPLENPRQLSAWRYPRRYGPSAPGFARAMRAPTHSPQLYISGTAAVVGHASHHPGDVRAQLDEAFANLDSLLAAARIDDTSRYGAHSLWKAYVRHPADVPLLRTLLREHLGASTPVLLLHGDVCRTELLVEIDGMHGV